LADVGRLLSQTLDSHSVGLRIVDSVQTLLTARSAVLYTLETEAGVLIAHTVSTDLGPLSWRPRLEPGVGTAWMAVDQRRPITSPDVLTDDRVVLPSDVRVRLAPATHRALLAVPLILPDRIVGALVVACGTGRIWSEQDAQIAQAFAAQAAIALENADLYAQSERSRRASTALAATSRLLAQAHGIETVAQRVVESVRSLIGGTMAVLCRFDPASGSFVSTAVSSDPVKQPGTIVPRGIGASALAARERRPVATPDITQDARIVLNDDLAQRYLNVSDRAVLAVPLLLHDDVVIGSLLVRDHAGRVFGPEEIDLARSFADHAVVALESARLHEEKVMLAHEEERRRITYDLHDGIAQLVVGAKQRLDTCQDVWGVDPPRARQELEAGVEHLGRTIGEMRRVLRALRPLPLDSIGLTGAIGDILKEIAREAGWDADLSENVGSIRFSSTVETAVFRIAQEALANARRHARATRVHVRVEQNSNWLELDIWDDGVGAGALGPPGSESRGLGLLSMRERATALGGTCAVTSEPGRGTKIAARIPLTGRVSA
jgi:signal transduction histidine kinase